MKLAIAMLLAYTPFFVWMYNQAKQDLKRAKEINK